MCKGTAKAIVIEIGMPLGLFRTKLRIFLVEKLTFLNIDISGSFFVKCF